MHPTGDQIGGDVRVGGFPDRGEAADLGPQNVRAWWLSGRRQWVNPPALRPAQGHLEIS